MRHRISKRAFGFVGCTDVVVLEDFVKFSHSPESALAKQFCSNSFFEEMDVVFSPSYNTFLHMVYVIPKLLERSL